MAAELKDFSWTRMISAVEAVRQRARRAAEALQDAGISYLIVGPDFVVPTLDALVRMKLTSFRLQDQLHLLDMLNVGLLDETWTSRVPPELAARLQQLIDSPDRE